MAVPDGECASIPLEINKNVDPVGPLELLELFLIDFVSKLLPGKTIFYLLKIWSPATRTSTLVGVATLI